MKDMDSPQVSGIQIPELHSHLLPVNGSTSGFSFRKCNGVMGVPITFLDKYCPEQFEIVWQASGNTRASADASVLADLKYMPHRNDKGGCGVINDVRVYSRILICRKSDTVL